MLARSHRLCYTSQLHIQTLEIGIKAFHGKSDNARVAGEGMTLSSPALFWLTSSSTIGISVSPNARSNVLLSGYDLSEEPR